MNVGRGRQRVWRWASETATVHTKAVLAVVVLVTMVLGAGLTRLDFRTSEDTLVAPSSQVFRDDVRFQSQFGGETMIVLLTGDVRGLFAGANVDRLAKLEGDLRGLATVTSVVGPLKAMQYGQAQLAVAPGLITDAIARETDPATRARMQTAVDVDSARLFAAGPTELSNPTFVNFLIFGPDGNIRPSMRDTFPDAGHAIVLVRFTGNASVEDVGAAAVQVKDIVAADTIPGFDVLATGTPVLLKEINDYLQGGMASLGLLAGVVMVVLLWILFRARRRLLPLAVVAVGIVWAFGAVGWLGISLSLVTISGLPIFIGLGVDFAIQIHNRYEEERQGGHWPAASVDRALRAMAPPLLVSMLAAMFGFLALRWSKVPMIQEFGSMLAVGVVLLVVAGITLPLMLLFLAERRHPLAHRRRGRDVVERSVRRLTSLPGAWVVPVVLVGLLIAGAGMVVEGRMPIQTEPERWVSQTGPAVRELTELRDATKFSDELDLLIEAPDVTSTEVAAWMERFGRVEVSRHPALVRATSMPAMATAVHGGPPTASDLQALIPIAPPDIASTVVSPDHTKAALIFPVGDISLADRDEVIQQLRADLAGELAPPPGTRVTPTGLAVIGQELVRNMEANRQTLSLAALALVAGWLLLRFRRVAHALLPLVPVAIALGASSLAIYWMGISLTPLTTVAGPLVIAVATEFAVLIEARYAEEREAGATPAVAVRSGLTRIGRAFVASGLTLIGGFGVLAFSAMPLLREFGIVVAVDVAIALLSTLIVLPPLLRWADERTWVRGFSFGGEDLAGRDVRVELTVEMTGEERTASSRRQR